MFVFSDDSILKTGNICTHSTPAQNPKSLYINREVQTNLNEANSNIIAENNTLKLKLNKHKYDQAYFEENPKDVLYYTGLPSYEVLKSLFEYVKDAIKESKILTKFEQLLLCLICLRLGVSIVDLSKPFKVSKTTISRIFLNMLEVLYDYLKPLINWPGRPELQISMPQCFVDNFGRKITVIIDCFELYIDQPKSLTARNLTWSSYKHHHTAKYLIGITLQGSISFISQGWGRRSSDQHITENSDFLRNINHDGKIMADRGFNISETLGTYGAQLVIPSFTRGKKQLNPGDVEMTRRIANV